eukprot:c25091_g1_i9 orf=581-1789(-)
MALAFPAAPPPCPPPWQSPLQLRHHLARLLDDVELLTAVTDELEALISVKEESISSSKNKEEALRDGAFVDDVISSSSYTYVLREALKEKSFDELESDKALALECATALQQSISSQVAPLLAVLQQKCTWEEASAFARLSTKRSKMLRNRKRRKKRRQLAAEAFRKEKERYDQADFEADEWRTREIAKDIAKRKIEKMKEVAKKNAKEERQKLERELELVLIVEKLQELRAMRIQRLKKQGSFFPEEDNRFMERVRAAVEEEERQAAAAADTSATAAAIANAEEAGKAAKPTGLHSEVPKQDAQVGESTPTKEDGDLASANLQGSKVGGTNFSPYEGTLPAEFYHYYYGSSADMGTLIEVRRLWDTFILPGGSRIPGHWVQPPPPADNIWGSCLLTNNHQLH